MSEMRNSLLLDVAKDIAKSMPGKSDLTRLQEQLAGIQSTLSVCAFWLFAMTALIAAIAWRVW